jgi:DNA-binding NtrC family response regulator
MFHLGCGTAEDGNVAQSTSCVDPPVASKRACILIVDDEPAIRLLLDHNLRARGYETKQADTAELALQMIEEREPDLLLLDLMLPGMDGLEMMRRVQGRLQRMPIVVLTAHGTIDTAVQAMKLGARDYLTKPFELERLESAVRNAVEIARLTREVDYLREQTAGERGFGRIVGRGGGLKAAVDLARRAVVSNLNVLVTGESGTGKELFARALHEESPRRAGPFMPIDCAALSETLLEAELFGHERGAFTGADRRRVGRIERAKGGTLFLDEIGEMGLGAQAKLLRFLQERVFERVGGQEAISVDVRVVAATHRDLVDLTASGRFREDLYYRLAAFPIVIPPLRDRPEDVDALIVDLLARAECNDKHIDPEAMACLRAHSWPGNVRELHNAVRRAIVLSGEDAILPRHLPIDVQRSGGIAPPPLPKFLTGKLEPETNVASLEEIEKVAIERALECTKGNLTATARMLGIGRTTLYRRLGKYGFKDNNVK